MKNAKEFEEEKKIVMDEFKAKCPKLHDQLLTIFKNDDGLMFRAILNLHKFNDEASFAIALIITSASKRISELEQTLSTYETALKSEENVPGQLEFDFMKETPQ